MTIASRDFRELRLDSVGRDFGGLSALRDVSLTIERGEFIALLGPSGCGKSTALNCIAGLLPLTAGSIWQDEKRIDTVAPEKRGFGMVFQNYALFPHMSVRRNIAFGLQMQRLSRPEVSRRTDEAIRLVQLEEHVGKLPGQLSGGQQQRVAIARAVVLEPALVLMDEPLSNLDAKLRLEMRTEIRRLHQSLGLTTVYVTHDQEEALSLADRLVVLRSGRVQQIGTPEELHARPENWHVADFMGYRNLLTLTATDVSGGRVAVEGAGMQLVGTACGDGVREGQVIVALRPDDVEIVDATPSGNAIRARVELVEYQGKERAVEARTGAGQVIHVRTPRRVAPGDDVTLTIDPSRVLVYPSTDDVGELAVPTLDRVAS